MGKIEKMKEKAKEVLRKRGLGKWLRVCYPFIGQKIKIVVVLNLLKANVFVEDESGDYHDIPLKKEVIDAILCLEKKKLLTIIKKDLVINVFV